MSQDPGIKNTQACKVHGNATSGNEGLAVIREEQGSPTVSSINMEDKATGDDIKKDLTCIRKENDDANRKLNNEELNRILNEKEAELRAEYDKILQKEMAAMKERFDYILLNEQTRASFMLREAHRERQEKISVLQSQLQCKNLAALMYVMCTEKKRSKLEKIRLIREYTNYIQVLHDILTEGQELILHLSRGYKTAARVDHEWREKMKKVVGEFLSFIYNFAGGSPETNQYFLDLPKLLKTEAPIEDNANEDPSVNLGGEEEEDQPLPEIPKEKEWWEQLDDDERPFVMFGDMSDFKPDQRREALRAIKAKKTAPKRWKKYVFNDMFLESKCPNMADIKDLYQEKLPTPTKWECEHTPMPAGAGAAGTGSRQSMFAATTNRVTGHSVDIRGNMGSLLKIITSTNAVSAQIPAKIELLGARDSMEITSTTKLRERAASIKAPPEPKVEGAAAPVLAIGKKRASIFEGGHTEMELDEQDAAPSQPDTPPKEEKEKEKDEESSTALGIHNDSLHVIPAHVPDMDHKINYERICPMEECQRLQMDSFMRSLPPYMRANPFTHFEQTFDQYETCTPEQLEMLKQRLESKKNKDAEVSELGMESPLTEWCGRGVAVQTSDVDMSLPPCTCHVPSPTPVSSNYIFNLQDLLPVKQAMDAIHKECLYDSRIEFDRFKVVGQESKSYISEENAKKEFKEARYDEIKKILKQHPSLLDIFQANAR